MSEPATHLRAVFERVRGSGWTQAHADVPAPWRDALERLAHGPDPEGALRRAGAVPDACLVEPFPPALCDLLHQGGYPARLVGLDPSARDVLALGFAPGRDVAGRLRTLADELGIEEALARVRNREYLWLARREVEGAPLEEIGGALSELVGACVQVALERIDPALPEQVVVLGMGKLGADELNFVSDIDLVFAHADELAPDDASGHASKTRLFAQLRRLVSLLEGSGHWRPLFRVDLRLRPFGTRGPLSLSLGATESYYERHGRDWERQVWLRALPLAGNLEAGAGLTQRLEPFVYRRSVSPAIFEEVAELMRRARRDARDGLGALDRGGVDLKHDTGGIRELEFFVQALQLLNGGRNPSVRTRGTLPALDALLAAGLLSDREHEQLAGAYRWLRRVEHRVQLAEGQQTHQVPADEAGMRLLASRLEPARDPMAALARFRANLRRHRHRVMAIAQTLHAPEELELLDDERARRWAREVVLDPGAAKSARVQALHELGVRDPEEADAIVQHLRTRTDGAYAAAGRAGEGADRLLLACLESADPDAALRRLVDFAAPRPAHYAAWRFLAEPGRGEIVRLVAELLGASEPLSRGLVGFRDATEITRDDSLGLMLEAAATRLPAADTLEADLAQFRAGRAPPAAPVELDALLLRFAHHQLVRIGLYDLGRRPDPLAVGHALSDLADLIVRTILLELRRAHAGGQLGSDPAHRFELAVLGLGKYGMQAMDYGSDLDLSFVFRPLDGPATQVRESVVRVARQLIARLEDRRLGARLYEVDMRLRPSGRQGLLVSSLEGFVGYHARPLPIWERLALLRLRPVAQVRFGAGEGAGSDDATPAELCRDVVDRILPMALHPEPADTPEAVAAAVRELKDRIEQEVARETRDTLNPKSGLGGCLEAELLVGALQLLARDPKPCREIPGALAELVGAGALAPTQAAAFEAAYRFERRLLNRLRMMQGPRGSEDADRLAVNSPRLTPLARRMGLTDADALVDAYRSRRAVIREAFDRHLPPK